MTKNDEEESTMSQSVEDALANLTFALKERENDLETREQQLKQEENHMEAQKKAVYGDAQPSDVLHLNVGGTKMAVLRRTVTCVPESMLASRFSGRWDDSSEKDRDGNFFIDQDITLFEPMINYLRNKSNGTEMFKMESPYFGDDGRKRCDFFRMVEYYGMTKCIYPITTEIISNPIDTCKNMNTRVESDEWASFNLFPQGHSRVIKSFEIKLGPVQRLQVGWVNNAANFKVANTSLGAGEISGSVAIDLSRSFYLLAGYNPTPIQGINNSYKEGTVIRCENKGQKWYVDGNLVATTDTGASESVSAWNHHDYDRFPVISVKGQLEISDFEYEA